MRVKVELFLDVPDKYIGNDKYSDGYLNEFIFDQVINELRLNSLDRIMKNIQQTKCLVDTPHSAIFKAANLLYQDIAEMFKNSTYNIEKLS